MTSNRFTWVVLTSLQNNTIIGKRGLHLHYQVHSLVISISLKLEMTEAD